MQLYESTVIFSPEVPAEKLEETIEKIKKTIENSNGKVTHFEKLGQRKMAYSIKKFEEGNYVYLEFTGSGDILKSVENFYRVNDTIIRYLTVKAVKKTVKTKKSEKPQSVQEKSVAEEPQEQEKPSGSEQNAEGATN
ncbi:MAG: 30S ribosomal protein S6 [Endomicrobiales bacterium]|nr:30S ribosomal protein S6 [Endomicrobiales bacterium]